MNPVELHWNPADRRLDISAALAAGGISAAKTLGKTPKMLGVTSAVADLRPRPDPNAGVDAQLLYGDLVEGFARKDGWVCVRCLNDGYVGWTAETGLAPAAAEAPTHTIVAARSFAYPGPDLKHPARRALSMGSRVRVTDEAETRGTVYVRIETGEWLVARHIAPIGKPAADFVSIAEWLIATPYLWGGGSGFGLDCSGLVQLAMRMCGRTVLRDSDMQAATIGRPIESGSDYSDLRRGDLVFWKGHVAICAGPNRLLHANGFSMDVREEPLDQALARIAGTFSEPTGYRRP
jgi:cell wall-associated NlpC family hydrolase